jgi:hypothetical protein
VDSLQQWPWRKAILVGLIAFSLGIGIQYALIQADSSMSDVNDGSDDSTDVEGEPSELTVTGWWHYSAQYVDVEGETSVQSTSFNYVDDAYGWENPPTFPEFLYRLVPIGLLVLGGYVITRREMKDRSIEDVTPLVGSSIAVGYAVTVLFGTFVFSWSTTINGTNVTYSVPMQEALFTAGLAYPIVFGSVGGYLAERHLSE